MRLSLSLSSSPGAPRTVSFSTSETSTSASMENVVISMRCAAQVQPVTPCVERCSRSIDRCTGGSAIWRDLAAGDRVAIVRSAIAHNTNRMFRGRTGGDRLRTHHAESVRSARSRTGTPVLRRCKRYFPRVRTVPCPARYRKSALCEAGRNITPGFPIYVSVFHQSRDWNFAQVSIFRVLQRYIFNVKIINF